jgi:Na+/phosphate symporter
LNIYFFWDSKSLGWIVIFIGLIFYLFNLNKIGTAKGQQTIWIKIGTGFAIFALALSIAIIFTLKKSEPYNVVIEYLKTDQPIREEVGEVHSFGLIPTGAVSSVTTNGAESGVADLSLTVEGRLKNKDVEVHLEKTPGTSWTVTSAR